MSIEKDIAAVLRQHGYHMSGGIVHLIETFLDDVQDLQDEYEDELAAEAEDVDDDDWDIDDPLLHEEPPY